MKHHITSISFLTFIWSFWSFLLISLILPVSRVTCGHDMTKYKRGLDYLWTSNQSIISKILKTLVSRLSLWTLSGIGSPQLFGRTISTGLQKPLNVKKRGHQNERNRDNFLFSLFEALSHLLFSFRQYLVHILPCKESIKYSTENERSEDFEVVV